MTPLLATPSMSLRRQGSLACCSSHSGSQFLCPSAWASRPRGACSCPGLRHFTAVIVAVSVQHNSELCRAASASSESGSICTIGTWAAYTWSSLEGNRLFLTHRATFVSLAPLCHGNTPQHNLKHVVMRSNIPFAHHRNCKDKGLQRTAMSDCAISTHLTALPLGRWGGLNTDLQLQLLAQHHHIQG